MHASSPSPVLLNGRSLHVNIYDAEKSQFTIPDIIVGLPPRTSESHVRSSDLVFNYEASPFSFWITRRSDPDGFPLFDTRISSLPKAPIPAVIQSAPSTALDGFPLVFEDRYLQVCTSQFHDSSFLKRFAAYFRASAGR